MGMEVIFAVIFWTSVVYWVGQNVVIDGMYAARGQVSPRRQERLARVARGEAPERYGFGGWFTDLTEDALRANTAKRRRTARQKAREKAEQEADARRQAEESEETPEQQPVDDMVDVVGVRGGTRPPGSRPSPRPRPNAPIPDAPTLRTVPVEERPPHTHNGSNGHRVVEPEWLTPAPNEHLIGDHPTCGRCGKGRIISVRADGDEQCNACGWKNPNLACPNCDGGRVYPTASGDRQCSACGRTYPQSANGTTPLNGSSTAGSANGVDLDEVRRLMDSGMGTCPECGQWRHLTAKSFIAEICEDCAKRLGFDQPNTTTGTDPVATEGTDMFNASGETTRVDATRAFLTELETHIQNSVLPAIEKCAASAGAENVDPEVVATIAGLRDRFSSAAAGAGDARVKHDDWARLMEEAVNNTANPAKTDYYRHQ